MIYKKIQVKLIIAAKLLLQFFYDNRIEPSYGNKI